ncbi:MAG: hypothetical protein HQK99_06775 [Nitrospirae bacterium]|nr:hypothetical protein [Nitrospirota bacterium]
MSYNRFPFIYQNKNHTCNDCKDEEKGKILKRLMVTPTFLKDINNTHLKMVWHNASLDLREAKRIFFVGYSLPLSDYEFRYMLLRALSSSKNKKKQKIMVILFPPDGLSPNGKPYGDSLLWEREKTMERYENLLNGYNLEFRCMDARDFMKDIEIIW